MRFFRKSLQRKAASFFFGVGAARFMSHRYGSLANEGYSLNPIVNACVNRIAVAMASVDLQVCRYEKKKVKRLEEHPLLTLLNKPNQSQSGREFRRNQACQKLIGGNSYILGTGINAERMFPSPPKELYLLDPASMKVLESDTLIPNGYEYRQKGQPTTFPVNKITGKSAILHSKTFNPLDPWYGLAPMTAAAYGVDTFNSGQKWNKALLDNEGRPSGALQMKNADGSSGTLSDDQFFRLKNQLDEQFTGASNAGRPLLLEGGLEWVQMSMTSRDMDHRENMLTNARFICSVYRVPPQIIGIPGESTFSNMREAMQFFWTDTVLPELQTLLDDLNGWLSPMYGDDIYIHYDEEMIPALELKRSEKANRINNANYLTIDEKRIEMGRDTLPGGVGNTVLVPSSMIPLDLVGTAELAEPGREVDPEADEEEGEE